MIELITLSLCLVLFLILGIYYFWSLFIAVPYVPSVGQQRKVMLELAKKYVKELKLKSSVEPGAGDCNMTFKLSKMGFQKSTAIEMIPFLTLFAKLRKLIGGYKNVEILNKDLLKVDYSKYDLAIIYLLPQLLDKLESKIFEEMPKGSYIISNTFTFKNHKPVFSKDKVYVYRVK